MVVDVGYKSEGLIPVDEFRDVEGKLSIKVGDDVDVLLERTEDQSRGMCSSRTRKAERMRVWADVEQSFKEGRVIKGRVIDRIKGGLTVDVGVRAFLPGASPTSSRSRTSRRSRARSSSSRSSASIAAATTSSCRARPCSRRSTSSKKAETLEKLQEGARMKGVVKNITDYGVFIDLGGIDGLLHITDISWGRVNHPSEHFSIGDEVEVVVLKFDRETERVSLGYKQKGEDPWILVDKRYPVGSRVHGKVVSLVDYGAFVELEEGVEGLIHVSEMSWTKKVVNPSKILTVGQELDAIVTELDLVQRRISLSLRQTERNPWEDLGNHFPVGSIIEGKVRNLTEFGAFVEITEEIDGLVHVSDMSWTKRIKHPSEVLKKGDTVRARITNIDVENQRVSLSIKEFLPNEWQDFVENNRVGDIVTGRVVNVTDFGLFIDIYDGLEGLAHISEIDFPGGKLSEHFHAGDWVRARILRIEEDDHKVGLTLRGVTQPTDAEIAELEAAAAAHAAPAAPAETSEEEGDH